ncbi:Peptidase M8 [Trypanosoma melophagium]|uniref:Peptidase M8 n=1 Tax=Trypanosoma melophagium TaxID=715481 RepID=UPI00351A9BC4|nr:Peptidase M8 [Trypanosoma melophagium]KAH9586461.1 Peptidase M8 [Trypanosoma melophagium]
MKAALKGTILPAAIKLHADRVLVDRVSSPLKVPEFKEDSICKNFSVPEHHRNGGVNDADMVVYVAARPVDPFGVPCAYDENSGRPVAGAINVQLYPLKVQRYNVRRIAHEIAHALGFDYQLFVKKNMVSEVTLADRLGLAGCDPYAEDRYPNEDYPRCMVRAHGLMVTEDQLHSLLCSETPTFDLSGSITADDSLCLDAEEYNITVEERGEVSKFATNGVCARVSCDKGKVKVMYAGISEWQECPEGRTMEVKRSDLDTPITLKCPKYSEVCTVAPDGSSRLPLVIPPGEKPATPPGTEGNGSTGGGADVGNGNQGGNNNVDNGNQGGDGCIVPAFLAPVLLLVMVIALLLH